MTATKDIKRTFRFREFQVYKDSRLFSRNLKQFVLKKLPPSERYCLTDQLWRALDSIILNVAEGSDRSTDKDFALFLNRSHTSLNEVVACLDVALDLGYITAVEHEYWLHQAAVLVDQLTAFRRYLLTAKKRI